MDRKSTKVTNEHILEVRYKPNPKILDYRGSWAEQISSHMDLEHWQIVENRIDIFSQNQVQHAFVGFRNAGFTVRDTPTKNFFSDKAIKLFRFLFSLAGFGDPIFIERIGVRSRFCTEFEGSFDELRTLYSTKFLILAESAKKAIGDSCKLVDIGGPLNFVDKLGNFNTSSGPMAKKQLQEVFRKAEGLPDIGFYFDIDYFLHPEKNVSSKETISLIAGFANESWERHERVQNLILGRE